MPTRTNPLERFEKKYIPEPNSGCWIWTGSYSSRPNFHFEGRLQNASRVAYILYIGQLPPDKPHVLHTCDFLPCVSPYHLYAGTHQDNMRDMVARQRYKPSAGIAAAAARR